MAFQAVGNWATPLQAPVTEYLHRLINPAARPPCACSARFAHTQGLMEATELTDKQTNRCGCTHKAARLKRPYTPGSKPESPSNGYQTLKTRNWSTTGPRTCSWLHNQSCNHAKMHLLAIPGAFDRLHLRDNKDLRQGDTTLCTISGLSNIPTTNSQT
jgi:hypothetical protein